MSDKIRVAVAGLTHGHVWGLIDIWAQQPTVEMTAVADATPLLERARARFARAYTDWRTMLERESPDVVLATADNRTSAQIAIEAMQRGSHVMVEKPMAAELSDASAMLETAHATGRMLMINWPVRWNPAFYALVERARAGEFGQIYHLRFRIGHAGPREIGCDPYFVAWLYDAHLNGGGASIDFGSYGAMLSAYLLGMPERVYGVRGVFTKDYPVPDDNAILLLHYPRATAVLEATWSQVGTDGSGNPIIYGTDATATVLDGKLRIHRKGEAVRWEEPPPLPEGERNPAEYFLRCIRENRPPTGMVSAEVGYMAQQILHSQ
ncbi:Glucose--fructose oxidoreductase [bacterium HR15]|nr:Glucose--fructose oxidoreductase [bacterium HR15]